MSEYEAVYLFRELIADLHESMFGYISLLSAFLIASYLIAHKLRTILMIVFLSLYTLFALNFVFQFLMMSTDAVSLYDYIMQQKKAGTYDLEWFGKNPAWAGYLATTLRIGVAAGGYIGSIIFFFYRRHNKTG
jgi:cellobiose-specific phosphotransferase system component IIC